MVVKGDDIIKSCASCFREKGLSVRLEPDGDNFKCPQCNRKYAIENGILKEVK